MQSSLTRHLYNTMTLNFTYHAGHLGEVRGRLPHVSEQRELLASTHEGPHTCQAGARANVRLFQVGTPAAQCGQHPVRCATEHLVAKTQWPMVAHHQTWEGRKENYLEPSLKLLSVLSLQLLSLLFSTENLQ